MSIPRTVTALKRWSCQDKQLPQVNQIQAIHVYDFDNTLFSSPLPNKQLWNAGTCGQLQAQDFLHGGTGGWWHNPNILAATGEGLEKEEGRAWEGSWNEKIVELVQLSMQDTSALSVLLTGRKEDRFAELIGRMLAAKGLEFDMVCLKPSAGPNGEIFQSTMAFKQALLQEIVLTYSAADELRIYEDRPKHTKGFRDFFEDFNRSLMSAGPTARQPFTAEVIQVSEQDSFMDPAVEVAEIQKMINANNQAIRDGTAPMNAIPYKIKRSVFYTGYIIAQPDVDKLRTLVKLPANLPDHELRYLANNIIITPRPAPPSILEKVGGIGAKMRWKVTGIAVLENKLWAVRVQPAIPGTKIYTENHTPCVVLATRRQAKPIEATRIQTWQPIPENQAYEFETTVGEKVLLRIEKEVDNEDTYEASFPNARNARKHPREEDFPPLGSKAGKPSRPQQRQNLQHGNSAWQNKPNGGGFGGGRGGNAGRGGGARGGGQQNFQRRGRGDARGGGRGRGRGGYRSLDDNVGQGYGSGGMQY